ncbi:antifreeze protein [Rhodobacter sp. NSM]|uniref:antifreeze protein n=1 Tax=Rhodobacter sp. NSM TaxID=3457501 RepID=UPI003FCF2A42
MSVVRLDICLLADLRVGDIAAPCHAAAAAALAAAGYRLGVLPVAPAGVAADPYRMDPVHAHLFATGAATRLAPGVSVDCALALCLDARLFHDGLRLHSRIRAQHRIVTVERPAALAALPRRQLDRLAETAATALGGAPVWAPTSLIAREALCHVVPDWRLTPDTWAPVAPEFGEVPDRPGERARPVIGSARIARSRPVLRPDRMSAPLPLWRLRLPPDVPRPAWPRAAPVEVWPDDRIAFSRFLSLVDILANPDEADHDPCPVEALLALRAGTVPYLPADCRSAFGAAALYGRLDDLPRRALDLHADRGLAADLLAAARDALAGPFSPRTFVARVREVTGPPRADSFAPAVLARPRKRVLFLSTNGVGMGHLTRQLAIARRLPAWVEPVFLSHSQAVDVVRGWGFPAEHLPYHAAYGQARAHWNAGLAETLAAAFGFWQPSALVFDGNVPFMGLIAALDAAPEIARIWIRRGFWGIGRDPEALDRSGFFDLIIEPGDPASALDDGPTAARRAEALHVAPIRLLDASAMRSREAACASLGLNPHDVNVLVAPGSGNNFATGSLAARALSRLGGRPGIGVAVARWMIARHEHDLPPGIAAMTGYPFARDLCAFDFALAAAGYNSFVEHLERALPTIWTPNEHAEQDRQLLRARWAEDRGLGLVLRVSEDMQLGRALERMLDPQEREAMRAEGAATAATLAAVNGAGEAAGAIASLCGTAVARSGLAIRGGAGCAEVLAPV